ncbi:hypothetical protein VVD49_18960 [Uliginosibacterium sp. H3]|uniref:Beta-ketoacyl-[acyl-carrier-protein] synthase III N-terminal domain-containing protein n=1 Tax=Uliginosibacterium silvisoli TaxID=3114758 RepID=A0ABU6K7Y3_9RHOO|nr:hypothetical protein [Uliginosibacterium sp. H3]
MSSGCVHIQAYCHQTFTERQPAPQTFSWVGEYYAGLLEPFGLTTDLSRLDDGMNNDFLSMGRSVMNALQQESSLEDVSLFLMAHQTPDTYFPFRSTTTRLCSEFNITAPAIGMTEQELTTPYVALAALLSAYRDGRKTGSGLLLALDQGTLPYVRPGYSDTTIDNALLIKVSGPSAPDGIAMNGRKVWIDPASRKANWISQAIYAYLDDQRIDLKDLHVVVDEQTPSDATTGLAVPISHADPRLMSVSALSTALEKSKQGCAHVLLVHVAKNEQLFLFSFSKLRTPMQEAA